MKPRIRVYYYQGKTYVRVGNQWVRPHKFEQASLRLANKDWRERNMFTGNGD